MEYTLIRNSGDLGALANEILDVEAVGLDLETTGLQPHSSKIRLCSLNTGRGLYVVDLFETGGLGPVAPALAETKAVKVGQNLKFDQKMLLYHYGCELWPIFDTFRASNLLYNGLEGESHGLGDIYRRELPDVEDVQKGSLSSSDWSRALTEEQYLYSAQDVAHMLTLRQRLKPKLAKAGLNRAALIEFRAILPEASMELNGLYLDTARWSDLAMRNLIDMRTKHEAALSILPHPGGQVALPGMTPNWNLRSPLQKLTALRSLGLDIDSTNETVLAMFAAKYPAVKALIAYNKASKLVSSFGTNYLSNIDSVTGRIHTNYYPFTDTGRYACSKPNIQQIPRSKDFRNCFTAPPGRMLVAADYSQIELRILAEISGDRLLLEVYKNNRDAHRQTAALISETAFEDVTSEMRQYAKPVNFGLCIAAGQRVLTHAGLVPIEDVQDWHLVWDGVEWVQHDGVIFKGHKEVMSYEGLLATPDHEVYTDEGHKIPFRLAASPLYSGRLAVGGVEEVPIRYTAFDRRCREEGEIEALCGGSVYLLPQSQIHSDGQYSAGAFSQLHVPERQVQGSSCAFAGSSFRSGRQRRALFPRESSASDVLRKSVKSVMPVYDILNAGHRHRFTVEGKIVSNCFGMGAPKLVTYAMKAYGVSMSEAQANKFRKRYFEGYCGVKAWHYRVVDSGKKMHMARTLSGRLRYLKDDKYTEYINTPIQGTAADGLKSSLAIVYQRLKKYEGRVKLVHMVHDEIVLEAPDDPQELELVKKDLEEGMIEGMQPFLTKVPVMVDGAIGTSWGEAH